VPSGAPYNVTIAAQPVSPAQACTVANGSGTVGAANVTSVSVSCVTTEFSIGGNVHGLTGVGLILTNNGVDNIGIAANGPFKFTTSLANGLPYNVAVVTQPNGPTQSCTLTNNAGTVNGADITNIDVSCVDVPL
jgi:hypothetical protein